MNGNSETFKDLLVEACSQLVGSEGHQRHRRTASRRRARSTSVFARSDTTDGSEIEARLRALQLEIDRVKRVNDQYFLGTDRGRPELARLYGQQVELFYSIGQSSRADAAFDELEELVGEDVDEVVGPLLASFLSAPFVADMLDNSSDYVDPDDDLAFELDHAAFCFKTIARRRNPDLATSAVASAITLITGGEAGTGVRLLRWARDRQRAIYGRDHPFTLLTSAFLGHAHITLARGSDDAEEEASHLREAVSVLSETSREMSHALEIGHPHCIYAYAQLVRAVAMTGERQRALALSLVAVKLADLGRHALASTTNRSGMRKQLYELFDAAFRRAELEGEHAVFVEVMELWRSQGLPEAMDDQSSDGVEVPEDSALSVSVAPTLVVGPPWSSPGLTDI